MGKHKSLNWNGYAAQFVAMSNGAKAEESKLNFWWFWKRWYAVERFMAKAVSWVRSRFNSPMGFAFTLIICTQVIFIYATFKR